MSEVTPYSTWHCSATPRAARSQRAFNSRSDKWAWQHDHGRKHSVRSWRGRVVRGQLSIRPPGVTPCFVAPHDIAERHVEGRAKAARHPQDASVVAPVNASRVPSRLRAHLVASVVDVHEARRDDAAARAHHSHGAATTRRHLHALLSVARAVHRLHPLVVTVRADGCVLRRITRDFDATENRFGDLVANHVARDSAREVNGSFAEIIRARLPLLRLL